jgi:excisionase family DNA binding protein
VNTEEPIVIVTEHTREVLLTVQEFASLVRVHPLSIYRLIRERKQRGVVRVGKHIRINKTIALAEDAETNV